MYILNRCCTKAWDRKTPFEAFSRRKPRIKHLKVFGSLCMLMFLISWLINLMKPALNIYFLDMELVKMAIGSTTWKLRKWLFTVMWFSWKCLLRLEVKDWENYDCTYCLWYISSTWRWIKYNWDWRRKWGTVVCRIVTWSKWLSLYFFCKSWQSKCYHKSTWVWSKDQRIKSLSEVYDRCNLCVIESECFEEASKDEYGKRQWMLRLKW